MPSRLATRWHLWLFALLVRVSSVLITSTYFSADEYWQCGEVAHKVAFGYGVLTWEWQAAHALRPVLPLVPLIILYRLLALLAADSVWLVAHTPALLQALVASLGDVAMHRTASRLVDAPHAATWTYALHLSSHFLFYTISRPFANSLETALVQLALSVWPWSLFVCSSSSPSASPLSSVSYSFPFLALFLAALSVVVRPSAVLVWLPFGVALVYRSPRHARMPLTLYAFSIGVAVLLVSAVLDRSFYGKWTCVPCNFLRFNLLSGLASRYGTQPWHWYFTNAWPTLGGIALPFALYGAFIMPTSLPVISIAFLSAVLSASPHKEFRFLLPVLPLLLLLAGVGLANLLHHNNKRHNKKTKKDTRKNVNTTANFKWLARAQLLAVLVLVVGLCAGACVALYLCTVHQRGGIALVSHLAKLAAHTHTHAAHENNFKALLLMPCHSTPLYSHLHRNVSVKYLDCSPPMFWQHISVPYDYEDESDGFFAAPLEYLMEHYPPRRIDSLPSHMACFAPLVHSITEWLSAANFEQAAEFFHSHFASDSRQGRSVLLYKRV